MFFCSFAQPRLLSSHWRCTIEIGRDVKVSKRYEHTQIGYLVIIALALALLLIAILMAITGFNWIAFGVLIILAASLILFASLTVALWEDVLEIRFGSGLIRKKFRLEDIESCRVVQNPWYYGWGIRWTPHGWLYNVSGPYAVEIRMKTGKNHRIGTDGPHELEQVIREAIQKKTT